MTPEIEVRDGLLWPISDTELWKVAQDYTVLEMALEHCKQRRVAIQAGGACGTFPLWLSDRFETVYTFEPDPLNFTCLAANCQRENVVKIQAALGDCPATVHMESNLFNCGAGHVGGVGGIIPLLPLDVFRVPVDLIQLDVEGAETLALEGALSLIREERPVIVIEDKGHHERFKTLSPVEFLHKTGYCEAGAYARDRIFTYAV